MSNMEWRLGNNCLPHASWARKEFPNHLVMGIEHAMAIRAKELDHCGVFFQIQTNDNVMPLNHEYYQRALTTVGPRMDEFYLKATLP
jgi:hypothetical protein